MSTLPPPPRADWQNPPGTIGVDDLRRWAAAADVDREAGQPAPLVLYPADLRDEVLAAVAGLDVDTVATFSLPAGSRRVHLWPPNLRVVAGI